MRSDTTQLVLFRNAAPTASQWRAAAEAALKNPYETPDDCRRRAKHYHEMADAIEAKAANHRNAR